MVPFAPWGVGGGGLLSDLLTTQEAAEVMRVHEKTVRRMILRGELRAYRVGRHYRIKAEDVLVVPVKVAERSTVPRPRAPRPLGRFAQIAREMDAA